MGVNFYNRDLRDLKFILFEYLDINKILGYEKFKNFSVPCRGFLTSIIWDKGV